MEGRAVSSGQDLSDRAQHNQNLISGFTASSLYASDRQPPQIWSGAEAFGQLRNASLLNVNSLSSKHQEHQKSENPLFMLYFSLLKCALSEAILPQSKTVPEHFRAFFQ